MLLKTCKVCGIEKDINAFIAIAGCLGGRSPRCRTCTRDRQIELMPPEKIAAHAERPRIKAAALMKSGFKKCPKCQTVKPLTEYHQGNASRWGKHGIASRCKECASNDNRQYRRSHQDRLEEYNKKYRERAEIAARRFATRTKRSANSPKYVMQITLRHGLNRKPTEFPATIHDLMQKFEAQNGCCAVTGIKLTWAQGKVLATSISLDRIDPNGGYSSGNIRLVCQAVNAFRGRMSDDEMLVFAKAIVAGLEVRAGPSWDSFPGYLNESDFMVLN